MQDFEWLGWLSSLLLLLTIGRQIQKQWREKTSRGVSRWLFVGQVAAEIGFATYSYLVGNWVFLVTNLVLLAENGLGLAITLHFRRQSEK